MNKQQDNDQDQDEIIIVESPDALNAGADERDDDDDLPSGGEDDRSTAHSDDSADDSQPSIQERRRLEKKERAERQRKARERDKIELNFLRQQNDALERRMAGLETNARATTISSLDREIAAANAEAAAAERVMAKAIEAKNGNDATKALQFRDAARERAQLLTQRKAQQERAPAENANAGGLSASAAAKARQFMADHPWYDPNSADEDSAIVLALDTSLSRSGANPEADDYWDKLRDRVKKHLPGRAGEPSDGGREPEAPRKKPVGGPQMGSGRSHSAAPGRREVYVSPERIAAMKEAGVWDDPVLRAKYVRRYEAYDRENKGRRA